MDLTLVDSQQSKARSIVGFSHYVAFYLERFLRSQFKFGASLELHFDLARRLNQSWNQLW